MIGEIIKASFLGFLPVAAFTFFIMQWSIASGRMKPFNNDEDLHKQYDKHIKAEKKRRKTEKVKYEYDEDGRWISGRKGGDFFHGKIMDFGGGYYGTMSLLTYIIIETIEIFQFLGKIFTPGNWFANLGFHLIIDFIVNSIMNFISAIIWFITLPKYIDMDYGLIWLGLSYFGYYCGMKLTTMHGDTLWAKLGAGWRSSRHWLHAKYGQSKSEASDKQ
jgi:hypothetical protein